MSEKTKKFPTRFLGAAAIAASLALGGVYGATLAVPSAVAQVSVQTTNAPLGFADLVDAVSPAVVSIAVSGTQEISGRRSQNFEFNFPDLPEGHPFRDFFDQFQDPFERRGQQDRPRQREFRASGSGFVISDDGFVVTNHHVVDGGDSVAVQFADGSEQPATIVGTDPRTDLALLKIDGASDLTYVKFADNEVRVGDWVVAVGNPFGLGGTVTAGIVSARGRDINPRSYGDFIQIDAAVNRGNSGGPAFNLTGEVVGVNTAIFSPNGGNVGIAFAIPASTVKQVIGDLMDDGLVQRGFLGVGIQDLSPTLAQSIGLDAPLGAMVTAPAAGGPAEAIGILSGDVITSVNGEQIDDAVDLTRTISRIDPGTPVNVEVYRQGEYISFDVTLATLDEGAASANVVQPEPELVPPMPSNLGLVLDDSADGEGVLIVQVEPESLAAEQGLRAGDVIVEVDSQPIGSVDEFEDQITSILSEGNDTAFVKAMRNGAVRFIGLPLAQG